MFTAWYKVFSLKNIYKSTPNIDKIYVKIIYFNDKIVGVTKTFPVTS